MVHFELIFVHDVKKGFRFIYLHVATQFSSIIVEKAILPQLIVSVPLLASIDYHFAIAVVLITVDLH